MAKSRKKEAKKASAEDVKDFRRAMRGQTATVQSHVDFPDAYYVRVTKVNSDGTFRGVLYDSPPCI